MNHPEELLPDYALGVLSPEEAAEIEAHLEACAACREELGQLNTSLVQVVEALPAA
jgi:anti-sigma factor RsiW